MQIRKKKKENCQQNRVSGVAKKTKPGDILNRITKIAVRLRQEKHLNSSNE